MVIISVSALLKWQQTDSLQITTGNYPFVDDISQDIIKSSKFSERMKYILALLIF